MAVIKFGGGIADARGSLGGTTFSRTRAGAIMRNRTKPVDPTTPAQSAQRNRFANIVNEFRNLSAEEIEGWTTFAQTLTAFNALGDPYVPQPSQVYQQANLNLAVVGVAALSAAPIDKPDPPTIAGGTVGITNTAGEITAMAINFDATVGGTHVVVEATLPMSASRQNVKKYFRQIFAGAFADPLNVLTNYNDVFNGGANMPVTEGQVISYRFRVINEANGFSSDWVYVRKSVPAAV